MERLTELITRSARRLVEAEEKFEKTNDPVWLWFLRRESSILLKRSSRLFYWAIKFWVKIRIKRY